MRALFLLLFTLLAGPAAAQDTVSLTGCKDDQADCRDECTVEYGGSTRTYDKLGACLQKCKQKYDKCRERQFAVQKEEKAEPKTGPTPPAAASGTESSSGQHDAGGDAFSGASTGADTESTRRSGVYRASDAAPEPEPKATARPEPAKAPDSKQSKPASKASASKPPEPPPEDTTELDQLFDEQLPPPPPPKSKAKAAPPATKSAPDSKKKDAAGADPTEQ